MSSPTEVSWYRSNFHTLSLVVFLAGCANQEEFGKQQNDWFKESSKQIGISFVHVSGASDSFNLPEIMGGGVAVLDVDNDGDLDIYFIQSGKLTRTGSQPTNELFLNDGQGQFTRAGDDAGLEDTGYGMGVASGDYDNDGDTDIFITNVGRNELFANNGDGTFSSVTESAGVGGGHFSTATLFADLDADGDLDLFVANYVEWSLRSERQCFDYGTGVRNYCDPGNYDRPTPDMLYQNNGDGTFTEVSSVSGITQYKGNALGAVASDVNGDGRLDIFVANDKTPNHLWINQGDLRFTNEAWTLGVAMDDHGIAKAGMGVVAADFDADLDTDILVVNIQTETDSLYRNEGRYFADATAELGLTRFSRNFTRFGVLLVDFNRDGYLDLYEANGKVTYSAESKVPDPYAEENILFTGTKAGKFTYRQPSEYIEELLIHTSRGAAVGDLDKDGRQDIVVVNRDAHPYVLLNKTVGPAYWLGVDALNQSGSAHLNARITVRDAEHAWQREVQTAGSYLAASTPTVYFTFESDVTLTSLSIQWADGIEDDFEPPTLNTYVSYTKS